MTFRRFLGLEICFLGLELVKCAEAGGAGTGGTGSAGVPVFDIASKKSSCGFRFRDCFLVLLLPSIINDDDN